MTLIYFRLKVANLQICFFHLLWFYFIYIVSKKPCLHRGTQRDACSVEEDGHDERV